jgi:hypothetical protein
MKSFQSIFVVTDNVLFTEGFWPTFSGIKHFRSHLECRPFQLWTDQKPLLTSLTRVSLLSSGRQQHHLAFFLEYTKHLIHGRRNI